MMDTQKLKLLGRTQALRNHDTGSVYSVFVQFREEKAVETVEFQRGGLILVDKGADDYPVGMQIVFENEVTQKEATQCAPQHGDAAVDPSVDFQNTILLLYFITTEMLRFNEFAQQRRGNALIREAISAAKSIPHSKVEFVEAA
jgi:hypothetical protein